MESLTSEFGMGSGVPSPLWLPKKFGKFIEIGRKDFFEKQDARAISTGQLHPSQGFHLQPINEVVYLGPSGLASGRTYLKAGFPLRCFQRLSLPNVANRPRHWRDDRHTRGSSTQVLSYYGQASSRFQRAQRIETKLSHDVLNPARVPL